MLATEVAKKMRRIPRSFHHKFSLQKTQPKTIYFSLCHLNSFLLREDSAIFHRSEPLQPNLFRFVLDGVPVQRENDAGTVLAVNAAELVSSVLQQNKSIYGHGSLFAGTRIFQRSSLVLIDNRQEGLL